MTKNDFIKVSGLGFSRVILAANAAFYKEHGFKIEEPTDEEIHSEFPEYQISADENSDPAPEQEEEESSNAAELAPAPEEEEKPTDEGTEEPTDEADPATEENPTEEAPEAADEAPARRKYTRRATN